MTHLARNADGLRNLAEGAIARTKSARCIPAPIEREADIDAGATRAAAELRDDLERAHAALTATWARMSAEEWERPGWSLAAGRQPVSETVGWRRRELLVHLVDLDVGVEPRDLPADYLEADATWLAEHRAW